MPNDGGGIAFIGVDVLPQTFEVEEETSLSIGFKSSEILASPLTFDISLNKEVFNTTDFSGPLNVTIPEGATMTTLVIQILNDGLEEGDEELQISMPALAEGFVATTNHIKVRVVDVCFSQAAWGSPVAPTFGIVNSSQPLHYYESLNGKSGEDLKKAIQEIIANPNVELKHTYGDVTTILKDTDQHPENSSQV